MSKAKRLKKLHIVFIDRESVTIEVEAEEIRILKVNVSSGNENIFKKQFCDDGDGVFITQSNGEWFYFKMSNVLRMWVESINNQVT